MKPKTNIEQLNKRISDVENHILYLTSKKKFVDEQVRKKLFGCFPFLLPSTSSLLYKQEKTDASLEYMQSYREMLFDELERVNKYL